MNKTIFIQLSEGQYRSLIEFLSIAHNETGGEDPEEASNIEELMHFIGEQGESQI